MNKLIYAILLLSVTSVTAQETDFPFGKPTQAEFELKRYDKDTTANAVVLREFGTAYVSTNVDISVVFEHHVRIKIFNEKGFKNGTVSIVLHKNDANVFERVSDIEAVTYYPDEQDLMRSAALDPKQVFKENRSKYADITKFTMPNLRNGCIIEYKYRIESPFLRHFRNWEFQSDIPKIYSEYLARIPAVFSYNVSLRGPYKLTKNTGTVERECYNAGGGFKADCSALTYAMADVPAFIEEDNMTASSNFLSAMFFELAEYVDSRGVKHKVTQEWNAIDRDLRSSEEFGSQMKKKDYFKEKLAPLTGNITDPLQKARAIYDHIRNWYRWDNIYGIYTEYGIKKAYESHTGNVADINLSLTAALLSAGLDAEAVLLSTRSNGLINKLFPVTSDFNYVISKVNISGQSYLLDATEPLMPFGLIPIRCINDQGRVMSLNKPSYWADLKASQKESKTYTFDLTLEENGLLTGKMSFISSGYAAYSKRQSMKKSTSTDEYIEKLEERWPKLKILKSRIDNVDSLDKPVTEVYDIEIRAFDNLNKDRIFLNPFLMDRVNENPFKLAERSYPVDLGSASDTRVVLHLQFPAKYELQSKPETIALALPNKGGKFIMQANQEENSFNFYQLTQLEKAIYQPDEYLYLKELFNKIVLVHKTDIVLKKKI
ncbi:DUF3857 domain-containing protein [Pararcticibacter amylolyticus]|uniref:DUF3857 domain-containing protein n=1 Tax=Pararcticibacter amylolyticus TaxID=2173175 RepID=A0A2U2PKZ4_9SPHI|nr:DUF3857 domain-containing protein [Pararcticibacter amylolyticus]PWG82070.1 DUF3857 domain-containing protein [Pararcticibacter amylolyticus]